MLSVRMEKMRRSLLVAASLMLDDATLLVFLGRRLQIKVIERIAILLHVFLVLGKGAEARNVFQTLHGHFARVSKFKCAAVVGLRAEQLAGEEKMVPELS